MCKLKLYKKYYNIEEVKFVIEYQKPSANQSMLIPSNKICGKD